jgi:anti-sigma regulatory factor (Ser/Thr protein kinase)
MAPANGGRLPETSRRIAVDDPTQVGEARRAAALTCRQLGFDEELSGRVSIIVTEAAANVVRHGGRGEVLLRALDAPPHRGFEMLALDRGPGIGDVARALEDGHSTGGTPGTGLGAIRRLSTVFEVYTAPGHGTAVLSQVWTSSAPRTLAHGAVCLAKPGEEESGDVWALDRVGHTWRLLVADGLGHGPDAREAAVCIGEALLRAPAGPSRALETAHLAARHTRGAAAALAEVEEGSSTLRYAGVGNVAGLLVRPTGTQSLVSLNGTLGQGPARTREFTYPVPPGSLVILSSDGLGTRWALEAYPGLVMRHPSLIAGVLYRDFTRRRDDVTVVVMRLDPT